MNCGTDRRLGFVVLKDDPRGLHVLFAHCLGQDSTRQGHELRDIGAFGIHRLLARFRQTHTHTRDSSDVLAQDLSTIRAGNGLENCYREALEANIFLQEDFGDEANVIGADLQFPAEGRGVAGLALEAMHPRLTVAGAAPSFPQDPKPVIDGLRGAAPEDGEVVDGVDALGGEPRGADGLADLDMEGAGLEVGDHGAVRPRRWSFRLPCSRVRRPARMSSTMALPSWVRFPSADKFPGGWGGRGGSSFLFSSLLFLDRDVLARSAWVLSS